MTLEKQSKSHCLKKKYNSGKVLVSTISIGGTCNGIGRKGCRRQKERN